MTVSGLKQGPPATQIPITDETAPKRGRGRPRGSTSAPVGRPPKRDLKTEISGFLMMTNIVMSMVPPLSQDALDFVEIDALASALAEEAKRNARFAKMLDAMLQVTGGAGLFGIVAIIVMRRAARHEVFGMTREMDNALGGMLAQATNTKVPPAPPAIDGSQNGAAAG